MKTSIALFRGINVGGRNILPMSELVVVLESLGLQNIKTYIQSGNVLFQSMGIDFSVLSSKMKEAIQKSHGFSPEVILLILDELENAIVANPYPEAEPKTLHFYFLASIPNDPDIKTLDNIIQNGESFTLKDKVFYLHAPEGIGRSKLVARVEKLLGVSVTARNWRSVSKIRALAK